MNINSPIKTFIADDESNNLQYLLALLANECPQLSVTGTASDGQQAIKLIRELHPELVFMDIEMPALSGFQALKQLEPLSFEVIFVTAYNQYAMQAFDFNAVGYITKPISIEKLLHVVQNAVKRIEEKNFSKHLFTLLENSQHKEQDKIPCHPKRDGVCKANRSNLL